MPFDASKPVQTRDGRKARILATDDSGNYPIVAQVTERNGCKTTARYTNDGRFHVHNMRPEDDLVNAPETRELECWLNIHKFTGKSVWARAWSTRELADEGKLERIACLHIKRTVTEGEGL